jgi:hypothetical protein
MTKDARDPTASRELERKKLARRVPIPVFRFFLLASVAVSASAYALVRYYTHPHAPMLVPAVTADAGEIPAPDLEIGD